MEDEERRRKAGPIIITISGPPGSGKSTVRDALAKRLGLDVVSAGELFRREAEARGMSLRKFGTLAERDPSIDRKLDQRMVRMARGVKKDTIFEGRLAGALIGREPLASFKVYVDAPLSVRARRIAKREGIPFRQAYRDTKTRQRCESQRYGSIYGLDPSDRSAYDLVVDSGKPTAEEVTDVIEEEFRIFLKGQRA